MTTDKPMTLADAKRRAEQQIETAGVGYVGWICEDARMLRTLLAATAEGPATTNVPTGAGDCDIVCDGCGEIVATPHSWAECCAAQKAMVTGLREKMLNAEEQTSVVIPTDPKAPLMVRSGLETFELRIEDSPFVNRYDLEKILEGDPPNFVTSDIRDLLHRIIDELNDGSSAAGSAHFNKGDVDLENQCYRTTFWRLAGVFAICAMNYDVVLRRVYGAEPIPAVDNDARELAFRGYDGRCECGKSTTNDDSICDECRKEGDE
jgi:hypothetical protein